MSPSIGSESPNFSQEQADYISALEVMHAVLQQRGRIVDEAVNESLAETTAQEAEALTRYFGEVVLDQIDDEVDTLTYFSAPDKMEDIAREEIEDMTNSRTQSPHRPPT